MKLSKLKEYVIFKTAIGKVKEWDLWQFGLRSNFLKNQFGKEVKDEKVNNWIV